MPRSKRKASGGGYKLPAAVDVLRDGCMPGHLFMFHGYWIGDDERGPKSRPELLAFHELVHQDAEKANGKGMQPHTHGEPKPRKEFTWDG